MRTTLSTAFCCACILLGLNGCDAGGRQERVAGAEQLEIKTAPFQLCLHNGSDQDDQALCLAAASEDLPPLPYLHMEGPRPQDNPATATMFPMFGWVVGSTENQVIPTFIWQGNRLSGRDEGTLYQVTGLQGTEEHADRTDLLLSTSYSDDPAILQIRQRPQVGVELHLIPPPGMAEQGIAVSLFSLDTPSGEGLYGMGARKDYFNQRGKRRNVWTEQQNTGLGAIDELEFSGAGAPIGLPTAGPLDTLTDTLGINLDVDDALLLEERTSFPNGGQAAYWVEAFVVGSRGWSAWTTQKHFQRLDLAATNNEKLRWQIVDSDEITLLLSHGGIESASRAYTNYWGRAPAPGPHAYRPWIDTLNQGEGEAAPNGQGFWGGQRARCEIEEFIAKSSSEDGGYDIPFGLIGVEGWQVIPPAHPACLSLSTQEICQHENGFPFTEEEWQAEVAAGTSFFNQIENCPQAQSSFWDYVAERGFKIAGYWNFFTTNPACPGDTASSCEDDDLGVPLASKQAYYEARDNAYFIQSSDGSGDHEVTTNRGGISSLIDFTDPQAVNFWQGQLSRMFDLGIDVFMHDFGELTTDDMQFKDGENLTESHNLFAFRYQQAARLSIERYMQENARSLPADFEPYYYARAGMTGSCSFTPGVFPGDESSSWDAGHGLPSVIPAMLNLSLSGCYAFTTDIGGYWDFTAPRTTEDLFIRWSQLAALTPIMRLHSSTFNGSVFPWTWAEGEHSEASVYDSVGIFRRYAKLKSHLIPLVDAWARRAAAHGDIGPVRPMILSDQSPESLASDYQWLLGEDLLVAPVIVENASSQSVYFPTNRRWQQVLVDENGMLQATGQVFDGGQSHEVSLDADLLDIPLFVACDKQESLLPLSNPISCN